MPNRGTPSQSSPNWELLAPGCNYLQVRGTGLYLLQPIPVWDLLRKCEFKA